MLDYCVSSSNDMMAAMESDSIVADAYGAAVQSDINMYAELREKSTETGTRLSKHLTQSNIWVSDVCRRAMRARQKRGHDHPQKLKELLKKYLILCASRPENILKMCA